jgi:dTDP-4-amino-4,6-dideoxygalactose transaminase
MNPHQVTRDFEKAVAAYTGAPYCVAVNSCTNALFLSLMWAKKRYQECGYGLPTIDMPSRSYVSVPMQIKHAGFDVSFRSERWQGFYELRPARIFDCARLFTSNMYDQMGGFVCTSHHWGKTLGLQQAGCILHSNEAADRWLRRARFDGRTEGVPPAEDAFEFCGWHMYLSPEIAALGLMKLSVLPRHNAPLPNDNYPDLSKLPIFRSGKAPRTLAVAAE